MGTPAPEAHNVWLAPGPHGLCAAETAGAGSRVLVQQVGVLRPAALAKVLDLHDLRQKGDINRRLRRLGKVVPREDLLVLN